ncbi:hypothetical protein C3486_25995 [Streptomyces sp. Ru73]|uniref:hypothetical protein n=1 Tax=Streptomyces sp. Ru73 TaxID=2080748 RepID=UPI000CDD0A77|nr:hypothetical protein [Streptomyces sp. Ru73]POX37877.1 hypothetical protein C3486_25995 [Streptomyces sp. Ru73]
MSNLLSAKELEGLDPAKDYDRLKEIAAVVTSLATSVGPSLLGWEDLALPIGFASMAIVVLLAFGEHSQQLPAPTPGPHGAVDTMASQSFP